MSSYGYCSGVEAAHARSMVRIGRRLREDTQLEGGSDCLGRD